MASIGVVGASGLGGGCTAWVGAPLPIVDRHHSDPDHFIGAMDGLDGLGHIAEAPALVVWARMEGARDVRARMNRHGYEVARRIF